MPNGKVERFMTGIRGLDTLMHGGVPTKNQVIIAGGPGSGKTLMCFEIAYRTAKTGIPVLFVAFEERPEDIVRNAKSAFSDFDDIDELMANRSLTVLNNDVSVGLSVNDPALAFGGIISNLDRQIKAANAKCVVIDSISLLKLISSENAVLFYRRAIFSLMSTLRELNVTAFLTVELPSTDRELLRFSPEFFIFDGVIVMYESSADSKRTADIEIIKMRGTKHSLSTSPYEITSEGFRVLGVEDY